MICHLCQNTVLLLWWQMLGEHLTSHGSLACMYLWSTQQGKDKTIQQRKRQHKKGGNIFGTPTIGKYTTQCDDALFYIFWYLYVQRNNILFLSLSFILTTTDICSADEKSVGYMWRSLGDSNQSMLVQEVIPNRRPKQVCIYRNV